MIRKPYDQVEPVMVHFHKPSKTKQAHADACDINNIVARYQQTGVIDHLNAREARYGDATGQDYHSAMNLIASAKGRFMELPAEVRLQFENDPALFMDYINELDKLEPKERAERLAEVGLAELKTAPSEPPASPESEVTETDSEAPPIDPT